MLRKKNLIFSLPVPLHRKCRKPEVILVGGHKTRISILWKILILLIFLPHDLEWKVETVWGSPKLSVSHLLIVLVSLKWNAAFNLFFFSFTFNVSRRLSIWVLWDFYFHLLCFRFFPPSWVSWLDWTCLATPRSGTAHLGVMFQPKRQHENLSSWESLCCAEVSCVVLQ